MSESGSDYSEPAESPIQLDDPSGTVSVWDENDLSFGTEEESADVSRKRPGAVQNSLRGANEQDVSETPPPKRPSDVLLTKLLAFMKLPPRESRKTWVLFALQCMEGFQAARSQNYTSCALSVHSPRWSFCETFETTAFFSDWGSRKFLSGSSAGYEKGIFPCW